MQRCEKDTEAVHAATTMSVSSSHIRDLKLVWLRCPQCAVSHLVSQRQLVHCSLHHLNISIPKMENNEHFSAYEFYPPRFYTSSVHV